MRRFSILRTPTLFLVPVHYYGISVCIYSHIAVRFMDTPASKHRSDPFLQKNLLRTLALYARAVRDAMVGG